MVVYETWLRTDIDNSDVPIPEFHFVERTEIVMGRCGYFYSLSFQLWVCQLWLVYTINFVGDQLMKAWSRFDRTLMKRKTVLIMQLINGLWKICDCLDVAMGANFCQSCATLKLSKSQNSSIFANLVLGIHCRYASSR